MVHTSALARVTCLALLGSCLVTLGHTASACCFQNWPRPGCFDQHHVASDVHNSLASTVAASLSLSLTPTPLPLSRTPVDVIFLAEHVVARRVCVCCTKLAPCGFQREAGFPVVLPTMTALQAPWNFPPATMMEKGESFFSWGSIQSLPYCACVAKGGT